MQDRRNQLAAATKTLAENGQKAEEAMQQLLQSAESSLALAKKEEAQPEEEGEKEPG